MTSLFALTYPYLSGYQHIGASLGSGVDISSYASSFGNQAHAASTLSSWNQQFGSLVGHGNQANQNHEKSTFSLSYTNANLSPLSCAASNNQVTSTVAREGLSLKTRKYTAKGTRSCPYNMNTLLNDDVSAIVRRRNERERERVRCVNNHYEHLKRHLPVEHFNHEKRISKLEVLRTAIRYIHELQNVLEQSNNNNTEESDKTKCKIPSRSRSAKTSNQSGRLVDPQNLLLQPTPPLPAASDADAEAGAGTDVKPESVR